MTEYEFYVRSICNEEDKSEWLVTSFETGDMGVDENFMDQLKLYPNPVQNSLNVEGQVLYKQTNANQLKISVENLQSGLYMMKVKMENRSQTFKLIKE